MRNWVEYKDGRVVKIDKGRLFKRAKTLLQAYADNKNGYGVEEAFTIYKPYLDKALAGDINVPIERAPITYAMREMLIPNTFEDALTYFRIALESRPAVYGILDPDTLLNHRNEFIKEENGKTYILEYFEDDELISR